MCLCKFPSTGVNCTVTRPYFYISFIKALDYTFTLLL
uniref:EGF-like domain-containing protein n=1 Tax=Anguilla anguilla TaxID=7936 RepID=A0A0E9W9H0_ANGAN